MKKILSIFSVLFLASTFTTHGQTFNVGVGGTYTTLNDAVNAYNAMTLTQPVTFVLTDATYTTATSILIAKNPTASSTHSLTIKPAPAIIPAINGTVPNDAVLKITGDHVIIDGSNNGTTTRDLTITNLSATAPRVISIGGGAQPAAATNISLKNTIVINGVNTTMALSLSAPTSATTAGFFQNITIENNSIRKSLYGINVIAATGPFQNGTTVRLTGNDLASTGANAIRNIGISITGLSFGCNILNNVIGNFETAVSEVDRGILVSTACSTVVIKNNIISNLKITAANISPVGIEINANGGQDIIVDSNQVYDIATVGAVAANPPSGIFHFRGKNVIIRNNKVSNIKGTGINSSFVYGIRIITGITNTNSQLINNFVSDLACTGNNSSITAGIYVEGNDSYQIAYNTVNLNAASVNCPSAPLWFANTVNVAGKIDCRNNILVNRSTNTIARPKYALYQTNAVAIFSSIDYNNYEGSPLSSRNNVSQADLVALQSAFGQNGSSVSIPPVFVSTSDLHLAAAGNDPLDNKGTPLTGIITDIDGTARSATLPDIGAHEFGSIPGASLIINCSTPATAFCPGSTFNLTYTVTGTADAGNIFTAQLSNAGGSFATTVTIGSVAATTSGTISVTIPTGALGNFYRIRVVSSAPVFTGNDNGADIVIQKPITSSITGTASAIAGTAYPFSVTATAGSSYVWAFSNGTQNSGGTTNSVTGTFNTAGSQTVSVTETNQSGCVANTVTKTVTVTLPTSTTWNGSISTAWDDPANWSNGVPTSTTDAIIPAGMPRYPTISMNTTVKGINVASGTSLNVSAGVNVIIIGN